jgi:hypothetical protein
MPSRNGQAFAKLKSTATPIPLACALSFANVETAQTPSENEMPHCRDLAWVLLALILLSACSGPVAVTNVQAAVDEGGIVRFPAGTYLLTQTVVVRQSNTVIQGSGPDTVFIFEPALPQVHCVNDRAFTTPCDAADPAPRQVEQPIAIGDSFFTAADTVNDLRSGDWLIVAEKDLVPGEVVIIDWVQVASASGNTVTVRSPFRTAFPNTHPWVPGSSGLGFLKIPQLVEGVQFRDLTIVVPDSGADAPGISVFAAKDTVVDNVEVQDPDGQPLYSYLSQGLTVSNSSGIGGKVLNEFAATVDLTLSNNSFSSTEDAGVGLDFGTGFFAMVSNDVPSSSMIGMYLLDGVHDGSVNCNSLQFVSSTSSALGILTRGSQRVSIEDNYLEGGEGPASIGISIGTAYGGLDQPIVSTGNVVAPNWFGPLWIADYDPTNQP